MWYPLLNGHYPALDFIFYDYINLLLLFHYSNLTDLKDSNWFLLFRGGGRADRDELQLGSLSHFLNSRAVGYMDLPAFPTDAPNPSVRDVEPPRPVLPVSK